MIINKVAGIEIPAITKGASCSLRFIDAVSTNHINPNAGFETLVSQFTEEEMTV